MCRKKCKGVKKKKGGGKKMNREQEKAMWVKMRQNPNMFRTPSMPSIKVESIKPLPKVEPKPIDLSKFEREMEKSYKKWKKFF